MNRDAIKNETDNKEKGFTLKLLVTVIAAFVAALLFRRSAGIIAMTPLAFAICFGAAFIDIKFYIKAAVFGISVFSLNSIENSEISVSLIFTALCLLTLAAFQYSVGVLKSNKKKGIILSSASALICIILSLIFIGNPISAISADKRFDDHIEATYPSEKSDIFGKFEFSSIYYDFATKSYTIDASCTKFPTVNGTITASKTMITDRFHSRMEDILTEPYILEMTGILRESFPMDNFSVSCNELLSLPNENSLDAGEGELYGSIVFEINLGGVQSFDGMQSKVINYMSAIKASEIGYAKIIFRSGSGEWYRRSVTIDKDYSLRDPSFETELITKNSTARFNSLLQHHLNKKQYSDYVNRYLSDRRGICHNHRGVHCFCFD